MTRTGRPRYRADIVRQLDRAKTNVALIGYDIPRAMNAAKKAETSLLCAERRLDRLYERQEKWEARVCQYEAELAAFDAE